MCTSYCPCQMTAETQKTWEDYGAEYMNTYDRVYTKSLTVNTIKKELVFVQLGGKYQNTANQYTELKAPLTVVSTNAAYVASDTNSFKNFNDCYKAQIKPAAAKIQADLDADSAKTVPANDDTAAKAKAKAIEGAKASKAFFAKGGYKLLQ